MRPKHKIFLVNLLSVFESERFKEFFLGPVQDWRDGKLDDPQPLFDEMQQLFGLSQQSAEMLYRRYRPEDVAIQKRRHAQRKEAAQLADVNKQLTAASEEPS